MSLTRKNLKALAGFPFSPAFATAYKKFCASFAVKDEEFRKGIVHPIPWANALMKLADTLNHSSELL